jgi:hypothetical protein
MGRERLAGRGRGPGRLVGLSRDNSIFAVFKTGPLIGAGTGSTPAASTTGQVRLTFSGPLAFEVVAGERPGNRDLLSDLVDNLVQLVVQLPDLPGQVHDPPVEFRQACHQPDGVPVGERRRASI